MRRACALLLIAAAMAGCATVPARGWETADQEKVLTVARTLVDMPEMVGLVREVDAVYMNTRSVLGKQEAASLTARWFRASRPAALARLRALGLGATDAELIVGLIVAGGMRPSVAPKPEPVSAEVGVTHAIPDGTVETLLPK